MSESTKVSPPVWFWIVAAICLVWNLLGVMAYISQVTMSPEDLAALPEAERLFYESRPAWATAAFAIAVWGGALGSLTLLLRKSFAFHLLLASLIGILVQMFHSFFISNSFEVFGPGRAIMPIMVIVIGIALVWFTRSSKTKGWIS